MRSGGLGGKYGGELTAAIASGRVFRLLILSAMSADLPLIEIDLEFYLF